jgi:hypothetical protein
LQKKFKPTTFYTGVAMLTALQILLWRTQGSWRNILSSTVFYIRPTKVTGLKDEINAWFATRVKKWPAKEALEYSENIMVACHMAGTWLFMNMRILE